MSTINVTIGNDDIRVTVGDNTILITSQVQGPAGPTGVGLPLGGTTGQILKKSSNTDLDTEWDDAGAGDMLKSVYDPQGIEGDAFDVDNHTNGTVNKVFTAIEKTKLAAIESGAEVNNISDVNATDLTDGGDTGLHTHDGRYYTEAEVDTLLDGKVDENIAIISATKTKITYDAKGLVTAGTDATTADIADSLNRRYVTDAQLTIIGNTSGANTGDITIGTGNGLSLVGQALSLTLSSTSTTGALSSTDWNTFNGKQAALGFTAEDVANKENVTLDTSTDKYPTNRLVKEYVDSLVVGLLDYRGGFDASENAYPTTGGSGTAGAVLKGDMWVISVAGTLGGTPVQIGDEIIANTDTPGQTAGNWNVLNSNISYVPEDVANKVTSISGSSTDTQYASAKLLYDQLLLKQVALNGTGFVKITGTTISYDNSTYLTSLSGAVLTNQTSGQTIGDTTNRLTKLWATDITVTNAIVGSITGNAGTVTGATLTTALTVNTGTVTLIGNVANTSALTIGAGAVSVSGDNTGDNATNSQYSGLAASKADVGQTFYIGTTQIAINRASNPLTLAGLTLTTPDLGVATATSINKLTITAPATSAILTIADGKTFTSSNTITLTATDGSTLAIGTGGTLGTGAYATIANYAPLASPTFTGTPAAPTASAGDSTTQLATTEFVQSAVRSVPSKEASKYSTTTALPTVIYDNGASGVGATITAVSVGAISIDGSSPAMGERILVKDQVSTFQNGIYTVTATGSGIAVFVLTRALDFNEAQDVKTGASTYVTNGTTYAGTTWDVSSADSPVMGTDAITFVQSAGPGSIIAGNGISISGVTVAIDTAITADLSTAQTLTNKQMTTIQLGHASDTTLARIGAGRVSVEGVELVRNGDNPQLTTIQLGHATDTTLSRVSAGVIAVEGVTIATLASPTFTGTVTTPAIKVTTGAGAGKVLTSDADGDATWETASGGITTGEMYVYNRIFL